MRVERLKKVLGFSRHFILIVGFFLFSRLQAAELDTPNPTVSQERSTNIFCERALRAGSQDTRVYFGLGWEGRKTDALALNFPFDRSAIINVLNRTDWFNQAKDELHWIEKDLKEQLQGAGSDPDTIKLPGLVQEFWDYVKMSGHFNQNPYDNIDDLSPLLKMMGYLVVKFYAHNDQSHILVSTGSKELVYHSSQDAVWGDGGDQRGLNLYGQMLERWRYRFLKEQIKYKLYLDYIGSQTQMVNHRGRHEPAHGIFREWAQNIIWTPEMKSAVRKNNLLSEESEFRTWLWKSLAPSEFPSLDEMEIVVALEIFGSYFTSQAPRIDAMGLREFNITVKGILMKAISENRLLFFSQLLENPMVFNSTFEEPLESNPWSLNLAEHALYIHRPEIFEIIKKKRPDLKIETWIRDEALTLAQEPFRFVSFILGQGSKGVDLTHSISSGPISELQYLRIMGIPPQQIRLNLDTDPLAVLFGGFTNKVDRIRMGIPFVGGPSEHTQFMVQLNALAQSKDPSDLELLKSIDKDAELGVYKYSPLSDQDLEDLQERGVKDSFYKPDDYNWVPSFENQNRPHRDLALHQTKPMWIFSESEKIRPFWGLIGSEIFTSDHNSERAKDRKKSILFLKRTRIENDHP